MKREIMFSRRQHIFYGLRCVILIYINRPNLTRRLAGRRVYVFDVENYWGGKLERARVADVSGHRKKHPNEHSLRFCPRCRRTSNWSP